MDPMTFNFSTVGAFVLANNKEHLNMDGCLWCFGAIGSSLKAVYFGHTNKQTKKQKIDPYREQRIYTVDNDILMQTFQYWL